MKWKIDEKQKYISILYFQKKKWAFTFINIQIGHKKNFKKFKW